MLTIGLTGGIGSGKSTVSQWFIKQGVPVIDADKTVHRILQSDESTKIKLIDKFGSEILSNNGEINRLKLGELVFSDEDARKRLERIVHPRVLEWMNDEQVALKNMGFSVCVWDVPLLFEVGMGPSVDKVWVVWVPYNLQLSRVIARDKLSKSQVDARITAQGELNAKCKLADVIIDNSGSVSETERQLKKALDELIYHNI